MALTFVPLKSAKVRSVTRTSSQLLGSNAPSLEPVKLITGALLQMPLASGEVQAP